MTKVHDVSFDITVNGRLHSTTIDTRSLLIEVVRDLGVTGARIGCLTGDCGACTVVLNGLLTKSCLVLAVSAVGANVTTIEGTSSSTAACLQEAFIVKNAFQCGYCTSGMILTAIDLLEKNRDPDEADIRHAISGNLCRCTGYDDIVGAIADSAKKLQAKPGGDKPAERQSNKQK
ncbi:MAG: 4-hydroxybenzoyl-CoA reductase subunit gamma [Bradyrhizobium sp.]|nr:4-hydroxybenzoyl-CoA reductase subunit gamma [Bradyrhizobium sp.]